MTVQVTLIGNATADPELRFTAKGDAQATFTVAVNERVKQGDEWVDGEPTFYRVTAWRKIAEQAAEHLRKGQRCIIVGKFKPRDYETKDGGKRTSLDVTADEIGLSIRWMDAPGQRAAANRAPDAWDTPAEDIPPF